jgi:hypothetical protein
VTVEVVVVIVEKVKSHDGKDVGEINQVSQNVLRLEKGTANNGKFCIPKYVADAYDGNTLWLFVSKDVSIKLLGFPRIGSGTVL